MVHNENPFADRAKTVLGSTVDHEGQSIKKIAQGKRLQAVKSGVVKALIVAAGLGAVSIAAAYNQESAQAEVDTPIVHTPGPTERAFTDCLQSPRNMELDTHSAINKCLGEARVSINR